MITRLNLQNPSAGSGDLAYLKVQRRNLALEPAVTRVNVSGEIPKFINVELHQKHGKIYILKKKETCMNSYTILTENAGIGCISKFSR